MNYSYDGWNIEDVLQVMFIYLKLTNQINWSWFFVLTPLWLWIFMNFIWVD